MKIKMEGSIAFKVPKSYERFILQLSNEKRYSVSAVSRALLERGLLLYLQDGVLFDPGLDSGDISLMLEPNSVERHHPRKPVKMRV